MPYVDRDSSGSIIGSFAIQQRDGQEFVPDSSDEVLEHKLDIDIRMENAKIRECLQKIDINSIRAIREYIISKGDAPQSLIDKEALAVAKRLKLVAL